MGLREKFEGRIKAKEQEIQEYRAKIREAEAYIQAIQDTLKILPREEISGIASHSSTQKPVKMMRKGSNIEKAYQFLRRAGKPQYISDILTGIGKTTSKNDRAALAGTLSWYVRKDMFFTRPNPGTYGLKEMKVEKTVEHSVEPPADFGLDIGEEK